MSLVSSVTTWFRERVSAAALALSSVLAKAKGLFAVGTAGAPSAYPPIAWYRRLRSVALILLSVALWATVSWISPEQLSVVVYKHLLVAAAALLGYWVDRSVFPYSRPDGYLRKDWRHGTDEPEDDADFPVVAGYEKVFSMAMLRRSIVIAAIVIGVSLGL